MNYLAACPVLGRSYLRTLIQSQPLSSDLHALKLAHICDRFALKPEKDAIYHQMGMNGTSHPYSIYFDVYMRLALDPCELCCDVYDSASRRPLRRSCALVCAVQSQHPTDIHL